MTDAPSWRKPVGALALLAIILGWIAVVASFSPMVGGWPALGQAFFYLIAGTAWIAPLGPLLRWMETGRIRRARRD